MWYHLSLPLFYIALMAFCLLIAVKQGPSLASILCVLLIILLPTQFYSHESMCLVEEMCTSDQASILNPVPQKLWAMKWGTIALSLYIFGVEYCKHRRIFVSNYTYGSSLLILFLIPFEDKPLVSQLMASIAISSLFVMLGLRLFISRVNAKDL